MTSRLLLCRRPQSTNFVRPRIVENSYILPSSLPCRDLQARHVMSDKMPKEGFLSSQIDHAILPFRVHRLPPLARDDDAAAQRASHPQRRRRRQWRVGIQRHRPARRQGAAPLPRPQQAGQNGEEAACEVGCAWYIIVKILDFFTVDGCIRIVQHQFFQKLSIK